MRPQYIIIIFLLIVSTLSFSQQVKKYYKNTYNAERLISEGQFLRACTYYGKAFKLGIEFPADLRNAFKCSLLSSDKKKILFFWSRIKKYPEIVKELVKNPLVMKDDANIVRSEMMSYSQSTEKGLLEKTIDSLVRVDQAARHQCPRNMDEKCMSLFKTLDSSNILYLKALLQKKHYCRNDLSQVVISGIYVIALHARRWGFTDLDSLIISYVKNGCLKPIMYAQLNQFRSDFKIINETKLKNQMQLGLGFFYMQVNDTIIKFKPNDSLIIVFNHNRHLIFMDKVQEEIKKLNLILAVPLFANCRQDLGIDQFIMNMSKEELAKFIAELRTKNSLKE